MKNIEFKKILPLFFMIMSFVVPVMMGHYLYKNNYLFDLGDASHGKILQKKIYVEVNQERIYKWTILKIGKKETGKSNYETLKRRQLFYNAQLLLNKEKKKINSLFSDLKNITLDKNKVNKNILKKSNILIIDPNSNVIMQYDASVDLKYIITDIKRLLKYARF